MLHLAILSTYCVPGSVLVPVLELLPAQWGEKDQPGKPRSPGSPWDSTVRFFYRPYSRCLRHGWEQMLGPEVKCSRLMIDDADLQPEVVCSGERTGSPHGVPAPAVPHDTVVPSFPHAVCPHVQHAWSAYSAAYRVFILRGLYREGPGPGRAKAGGMGQIR